MGWRLEEGVPQVGFAREIWLHALSIWESQVQEKFCGEARGGQEARRGGPEPAALHSPGVHLPSLPTVQGLTQSMEGAFQAFHLREAISNALTHSWLLSGRWGQDPMDRVCWQVGEWEVETGLRGWRGSPSSAHFIFDAMWERPPGYLMRWGSLLIPRRLA